MTDQYGRENEARRALYGNLMVELKVRISIVDAILKSVYGLPPLAAYELAYLQFRLICELIALGCLTAHGDIPATQTGKLLKAYQADAILNLLEKLHPKFYPVPGRQIIGANGRPAELKEIKTGYMTKDALVVLYHECGDLLHRGTLRNLKQRTAGDFNRIRDISGQFIKLLSHHQIQLIDPRYQLWVIMEGRDNGGAVQTTLFERINAL